jgi:uncharacterized protein (DUF1501 family)
MLSRRDFLGNSAAGAAGIALAALPAGVKVALAAAGSPLLVVIFLRGAADTLSLVAPAGNAEYQAARPTLALPASGTAAGTPLAGALNGQAFRLHPSAAGLAALYAAGQLAIIHAAGLTSASRSHFLSQEMMERGYGDAEPAQATGWIARHLAAGAVSGQVPILAASAQAPMALLGEARAVSMTTPAGFRIAGGARNAAVLARIAQGGSRRAAVMRSTLEAVTRVAAVATSEPPGAAARPGYGAGELATALKTIADLARAEIGLTVATADFGGWDTHDGQAARFSTLVARLSQALAALHADLSGLGDRLTVVVMSEFGRRLLENQNRGTDHGHGGAMLVSGPGLRGGLYGAWPGLKPAALDQGRDLAITTDHRQVLAEILARRCGQTGVREIFPTVSGALLGFA